MRYKWSMYNYFVFDEEDFTCYNTKTGAVLFGEVKRFDSNSLTCKATSLIKHEYFSTFLEYGFIIDENINEIDELKALNNEKDRSILHLTLIPTLDCNFVCSYCYQWGKHDNYYMKPELEQNIIDFIEKECDINPIESIQLTWFGGEPTLSLNFITNFMQKLTDLSRKTTKFKTTTTIVTNGYLLTPSVFKHLYDNYVRIFQITLDGDESNHDKYRILKKNNSGSFQTIYENLIAIKKLKREKYDFLIQIRANFFKDNLSSMKQLVKLFKKDFDKDKRFSISFRPVLDFTGDFAKDVASKLDARKLEAEMMEYMQSQEVEIKDNNPMFSLLPVPISRWCKASEELRYVINYDGKVYRCNSAIGNDKFSVGHIENEGEIILRDESLKKWKFSPFEKKSSICISCKRLPICMGGCIKERNMFGKNPCHWTNAYINNMLRQLLILNKGGIKDDDIT